jgi:hypothetical protein
MLYIWCAHLFETLEMPGGYSEDISAKIADVETIAMTFWLKYQRYIQ